MRNLFLLLATLVLLAAAILRLSALHAYPPGPHYDEAVNLLVARGIAFGGDRPFPIIEAYQGREVLYMYLNAALLPALGDRMFTFHLTNAWLNLLTIAASMALGRAMFRGRRGWVVGLTVGVLMALSFPQLWLARQAFRAVTLPFCQALALLFLWRGLRTGAKGWGWLAAGGLFAGLTLYTYMASRLFPLWLLVAGVMLLALDRRQRGLRLRQGLIFFGVLGLVALPMGIYALQKPDIFLGRLSEVTQPGESVTLAQSIVLHLRMFFVEGDPYLRYNIPGRPYFTWPEGLLLLAGLAVAAWRLARGQRPLERVAYGLALLSPLMVVPSLISVGGLPPSHMRSIGMVPLIFILVALGFEVVWSTALPWLARLIHRDLRPLRSFAVLLVIVLLAGGLLLRQTYFAWAGRADLFYETDADLAAAAAWLPSAVDADTLVYVAARDRGHPTVQIAATPPITWLGTESLFRAPPSQDGLYIFPRSAPPPARWLEWLEPGRVDGLPLGPDGRTAFEAFRVSGDTPLPDFAQSPADPVDNRFVRLVGVTAGATAAGGTATVETAWTIEAPPDAADLTPIVQLEDANHTVLSRADAYMTETDRWRAGETLIQRLRVPVPYGTPPGVYSLRLAWVARAADRYVPFGQGSVWATVGTLQVVRPDSFPSPAVLSIGIPSDVAFADGVRLLGWNPPPLSLRPGETLPLALFWQATPQQAPRPVVAAEAVLRNETGETALWQGELLDGRYGTDKWEAGELVTDHAVWPIPRDLAAGDYQLVLRSADASVTLANVSIAGLPRDFERPDSAQTVDAAFGGVVALVGYDLTPTGTGFTLDLVWQALAAIEDDYTVFVHVVDAGGNIVAQRDVFPQDGAYPTSLWLAGEYVRDRYVFDGLPAGDYDVLVGLYSQETGQRLTVTNDTHSPSGHINLLQVTIES